MTEKESSSSSNIVWVALAGILGLFALGSQKPSGDSLAPRSEAGSKEENKGVRRLPEKGGPLEPLDSFFSSRKEQKLPFTAHDHAQLHLFPREYLILTVPDPVDSQFGYLFDQFMDVTERALEGREYVLDRAWLPWESDKRKQSAARVTVNWQELADVLFPQRKTEDVPRGESAYREENPGTLLFRRHTKEGSSLCIVFVVGENPTSGIDKRSFAQAIKLTQEYPAANDPKTIRVVGPSFTGSQTSMHMVLHDSRHHGLFFDVISGNALGVDPNFLSQGEGGRVRFSATVIPSKHVTSAVLHYLALRERSRSDEKIEQMPAEEVALLVESNTGSASPTRGSVSSKGRTANRFPIPPPQSLSSPSPCTSRGCDPATRKSAAARKKS